MTSTACTASAPSTTRLNTIKGWAASKPVRATVRATSPKTPIGAKAITQVVIFMITANIASQKRYMTSPWSWPTRVMK